MLAANASIWRVPAGQLIIINKFCQHDLYALLVAVMFFCQLPNKIKHFHKFIEMLVDVVRSVFMAAWN